MSKTEDLLGRKIRYSGLETREYGRRRSATLTTWHPLSANVVTNLADKRRSLGRCSSLSDSGHGVWFSFRDASWLPMPIETNTNWEEYFVPSFPSCDGLASSLVGGGGDRSFSTFFNA
jgi:hypothetical protein